MLMSTSQKGFALTYPNRKPIRHLESLEVPRFPPLSEICMGYGNSPYSVTFRALHI